MTPISIRCDVLLTLADASLTVRLSRDLWQLEPQRSRGQPCLRLRVAGRVRHKTVA